MHVLDAGFTLIPPGTPYPPHQHPEDHHFAWENGRVLRAYTFVYITRGQGICQAMQAEAIGFEQVIAAQCAEVIVRTMAAVRARHIGGREVEAVIRQAKSRMLADLRGRMDMPPLAKDLCISYSRFRQVFKEHTGFAPHQSRRRSEVPKNKSR